MPGYAIRTELGREVEMPVWRALCAADTPLSVAELHLATRAQPNAIQHRLSRWAAAGLVTRHEGTPKRFAMNDTDPPAEPPIVDIAGRAKPRQRTTHERLWSAMRVLKRFDVPTLMITAEAKRSAVTNFMNCLRRSGHLRLIARAGGGKAGAAFAGYQLVRNTGPRAPSVAHHATPDGRMRELVDRNTGERIDISPRAVSLRIGSADVLTGGGEG